MVVGELAAATDSPLSLKGEKGIKEDALILIGPVHECGTGVYKLGID